MRQQFFKILEQKYPNKAVFVSNLGIFALSQTFANIQIPGCCFKIRQYFLKNLPKDTLIRHFQSQIQAFLFFRKVFQIDKFEGANSKYENSFLKFQPKNIKIKHFLSQIQTFLLFCEILQIYKFQGATQNMTRGILGIFIFLRSFPNR